MGSIVAEMKFGHAFGEICTGGRDEMLGKIAARQKEFANHSKKSLGAKRGGGTYILRPIYDLACLLLAAAW